MENSLATIPDDIESLKKEISERKKSQELANLKQELYELNLKAKHELNEFQGGMKQVDTHQILKSKSRKRHMADLVISGFLTMMSPRPVARNILAIALIFVSVFCLMNFLHIKQIEPYKIYFAYFIEIAAAVQILKSASRSLLIPVIATVIGACVATIIPTNQLFLMHHQYFFQALMIIGITGITISVFTID